MICQLCGYKHENTSDLYGCPNCNGEGCEAADILRDAEADVYDRTADDLTGDPMVDSTGGCI